MESPSAVPKPKPLPWVDAEAAHQEVHDKGEAAFPKITGTWQEPSFISA